ncbi:MAG TPA: hypothetical protein VN752_10090 [Solirubrobacterales bacterium]|nr:hypothetical protein [Solirubrobacterales bacterium]
MGLNLAARCLDCKVQMGMLRGYESAGIAVFAEEHRGHRKALQVDNGWVRGSDEEEWSAGQEGFKEDVYPPDWPPSKQPERYRHRGY